MANCNNCVCVSLTEEQQTNKKIDHICMKHNVRVFHKSRNPKIEHNFLYPCKQCNGKDFIHR